MVRLGVIVQSNAAGTAAETAAIRQSVTAKVHPLDPLVSGLAPIAANTHLTPGVSEER